MSKNIEIFCDVDGVVYNLNKHVIDIMNDELSMDYDYKQNSSWWWLDTGVNKKYFQNLLLRQGVFKDGDAVDGAVEWLSKLYYEGFNIVFISAPQWMGTMMTERVEWLKNTFEWFDQNRHLVFTSNKTLCCKANRILIDDCVSNLDSWYSYKICYAQRYNAEFKGTRLYHWKSIYQLIKIKESEYIE